jgi:hypothetical protein
MLLDGQNSIEILMDHQLKKKLDEYPLIIIPEWTGLEPGLKQQVLEYVIKGGKLFVIGANAVKEFEPQLGVTFSGKPETSVCTIGFDNQMVAAKTTVQQVKADAGTQLIAEFYHGDDFRFPTGNPAATIATYGKGKIAACYLDLAGPYYTYQAKGFSKLVSKVIGQLLPEPIVKVKGSDYIHTSVSQKDGKMFIHLINTSGSHFNQKVYEYDQIPATGDLSVEISTPKTIKNVVLQPEGKMLKFNSKNGKIIVSVPSIAIHSIIQLEF